MNFESVIYVAAVCLIFNCQSTASTHTGLQVNVLTDFTETTENLAWYVQNDGVMGGLSEGSFTIKSGVLNFTGSTNTNGGGFSSIRSEQFLMDLSDHDGIRLKAKGDGRRYSWQLQTTATLHGRRISYWADFETIVNQWISVDIPFTNFKPQFRGRKLDGPALEQHQITSMGLYIYDKNDGPFNFDLDRVSAYSGSSYTTAVE